MAFFLCCATQMMAQLNGSGYYRLKNVATGNYISLANNKFDYYTIIHDAATGAKHMVWTWMSST